MYDHVLVPISFDEDRDSAGARDVAALLAGAEGRITLIHVMEQIPGYAISYVPRNYLAESRDAVQTELANMAAELPDAEGLVVEGHSGRTIVDWAEANDVDCIVIASHRPGMSDLVIGSTATQVVRHANCSVHVIR
ncbi:universal stress protein [Roseovarius sp. SYSU LYC5161]|jgi:nucleotide-binding universal stress UspA family protein|uniref:universal stress protein n=1 Tax=Roseovarius halophilus (ex Wu et al. 2025) TaxID=3376060 RepID=UPI002870B788|nr:universal stress protein [Roseovarius sp.]